MSSNFFPITCTCLMLSLCVLMTIGMPVQADSPKAGVSPVVQANNQFATGLYGQLDKERPSENLFFSPTSISLALSMTAAGAKGQTETEMAKTLCLADSLPQAHAEYHKLLGGWNANGKDRGYQLRVANRLWGQKGFAFLENYLTLTRQEYGAAMGIVDFSQTEAARREINSWVEKQTAEKIKDLLPAGAIDASTRLVLTNAIYFKGDWIVPFKKEQTHDEDFKVSVAQKVKVPMMRQKRHFSYMENDSLQALDLPYKGGELSMMVLLPKKVDGLPDLEKSLSAAKIGELRSKYAVRETELFFPKFKLDASFSLSDTLKSMGMKSAFTREADFSGIDGSKDLFISTVIHKAFVDVNETGTEAAAATGVAMAMAMPPNRTPPAVFRADHPFLFLICSVRDGNILFMGRMSNPPAAK